MIINQDNGPTVPDNTIAFFPIISDNNYKQFNLKDIGLFLNPLKKTHQRNWFTPHFYKCLPLAIGNMQGFVFSLPYGFDVFWNGGDNKKDITINFHEDYSKYKNYNFIYPATEFGHGIFTIHFPLTLKTPPGINIMTIAPPNFPTPGLSPMTGVVESDNLRFTFTLNIKIDLANTLISILPNNPLVGIIPIPRYFCDSFELKNAYEIFDKKIIEEEMNIVDQNSKERKNQIEEKTGANNHYYLGKDVQGNTFKDHQLPKKNKVDL